MLNREEVLKWLYETDPAKLAELYGQADAVRKTCVGDEVHLRGLVEVSNYCIQNCEYCGLRRENVDATRYRMQADEVVSCAHEATRRGYGTIVLQSGEDYGLTQEWITDIVRRIKAETPLAVTLSFGERPIEDFIAWRAAGADRYLLKFETSDDDLYARIHPPLPDKIYSRRDMLRKLIDMGYEGGSGVMIGLPGQTWETLADDLLLFREMELDMIGAGPFLPHPQTPLGAEACATCYATEDQVPSTEEMGYKVVALTRLLCPDVNIPSTTALASMNREEGRKLALLRGANVVMPNLTPAQYRRCYEIYPEKLCFHEDAQVEHELLLQMLASIGRPVGRGPGGRRRSKSPCCSN